MTASRKKLLIMLAAVLLMALLLFLVTRTPSSCSCAKDSQPAHSHADNMTVSQSDANTLLINRQSDDLESMVLTNKHGTYHIARGENGELDIAELSGLPLETDFIELAWFSALQVSCAAKITPDDDLASLAGFGLENPQTTVECRYKNGDVTRVMIGDLLPDEDGRYYFMVDGDSSVYVTDFNQSFFQGDTYWLSDDFFGSRNRSVDITDVSLSGAALPYPLRIYANTASESWQRWYGYKYIINENGAEYPADDYTTKLFLEELEDMLASEAVCARPSPEQVSSYGLETPGLVVRHKRDGREYVIRISRSDYSKSYAMVDGIDVVYELTNDTYPVTSDMSVGKLRSPDVIKLYFDSVRRITVQSDGGEHRFELSREALKGVDPPLYEYHISSSGGGATLTGYKALLEVFNSAQATDFTAVDTAPEGSEPVLCVTVEFFDERRPPELIALYPSGNRRYLFTINGKGNATVTQKWLDKFISDAAKADSGQEVDP